MRRVRYNVAASLDGYIAGPQGEFDWIPDDPTVDFNALFAGVDTVLIGRRSYEAALALPAPPWKPDARVYVISRTLRPSEHPGVTVVRDDPVALARSLRREPGTGEIWLFGGGRLFATLLVGRQVDAVEVTIVPVLLGGGVPLLPAGAERTALELVHSRVYPSGMVAVQYNVPSAEA